MTYSSLTMKGLSIGEYRAIHKWILRHYGKATKCEKFNCPGTSKTFDWSLLKGLEHSRDILKYHQLCRSCHFKDDMTEERKRRIGINSKKMQTVEHRKKYGQTMSKLMLAPEYNKKLVKDTTKSWKNPIIREKRIEGLKRMWIRRKAKLQTT